MKLNPKDAKTMKGGNFEHMDEALYLWFKLKREQSMEISSDMIKQKMFRKKLYPQEPCRLTFSNGCLYRFVQRHQLSGTEEHGERASADTDTAAKFIEEFSDLTDGYSEDQIFNEARNSFCCASSLRM